MWQTALEWLNEVAGPKAPPRIYLGERPPQAGGVVVEISLGEHARTGGCAHARLSMGPSPRQLRQVVRFCARQALPIDAWLITGLWRMPARTEHVARWIRGVAADAGGSAIWIDTGRIDASRIDASRLDTEHFGAGRRMPARFERRLLGHLRRAGCEVW